MVYSLERKIILNVPLIIEVFLYSFKKIILVVSKPAKREYFLSLGGKPPMANQLTLQIHGRIRRKLTRLQASKIDTGQAYKTDKLLALHSRVPANY